MLDDIARFILLIETGVQGDRFTALTLSPEILAQPACIARNQAICRLKNDFGRAIILLKSHRLSPFEILGEALNVFHPSATPAVNRLIIIAYRDHWNGLACQHPQPGVLDGIGVLELIHQNRFKPLLVVLKGFRGLQP